MEQLGIPAVGYSLAPDLNGIYQRTKRQSKIPEVYEDVRDIDALEKAIRSFRPGVIIHMAAQPLVLDSYKKPRETFEVNVMGTVNILEVASQFDYVKSVCVVTTDKVYENHDTGREFIESDSLKGKDPYSASKVATEAVVDAWRQINKLDDGKKIFSVRAGNVIGGGDYSNNRLFPDLIRGIENQDAVLIRNPKSIRPWQHVLDPIYGYLLAIEASLTEGIMGALNFGPEGNFLTVKQLVEIAQKHQFGKQLRIEFGEEKSQSHLEANILKLNSSMAGELLGWRNVYSAETAALKTLDWWAKVLESDIPASHVCKQDVINYLESV